MDIIHGFKIEWEIFEQPEYDCKSSIWCWVGQDDPVFGNVPEEYKHLSGYMLDSIQFNELLCYLDEYRNDDMGF